MKIVVITPSKKNDVEISSLIKMLEAGLDTVHIRKPSYTTKELNDYIKQIPIHFHSKLIIHTHHKLALKYNLKGFHFTSSHLNKKFKLWWNTKLIYLRKPKLIKSISYRRVSQLYEKNQVDTTYCFLGTMFNNISGELYSGFYPENVDAALKKSGRKIYARGGINEKSIELAHKIGFEGVALYSHLWKSNDPFETYISFLRFCKDKNIPTE